MSRCRPIVCFVAVCLWCAVLTAQTHGQNSPPPSLLTGHARGAISYYGSTAAAYGVESMPRRPGTMGQGQAGPMLSAAPKAKPFSMASNGSTVSPFLNLDREEGEDSIPNYFTFVRPQMQQQEANRLQQAELQRLERQVQRVSTFGTPGGTAAQYSSGHGTRYLDTAGYYARWNR